MILSRILYIYSHPVNIQRLGFPPVAAFGPVGLRSRPLISFFLDSNMDFETPPGDPTAAY